MPNNEQRNLAWARSRVCGMLHANVEEADEAFSGLQGSPYELIDEALTDAYDEIIGEAATNVDPDHFKFTMQQTWLANQQTYDLPFHLDRTQILYMRDVTGGLPGIIIEPGCAPEYGRPTGMYWSAPGQLTWSDSTTGPSANTTLLIGYIAGSIIFNEPLQEPVLIPFKYRRIWPLRAACILDPAHVLTPSWMELYERGKTDYHQAINQTGTSGTYAPGESESD